MFAATLIEAGVWAAVYLGVDALGDFETAFYFSVVTYTTLGFGDVVIGEEWRILSAFEAVNGVMMFGWTTALVVVAIHRFSRTLRKLKESDPVSKRFKQVRECRLYSMSVVALPFLAQVITRLLKHL